MSGFWAGVGATVCSLACLAVAVVFIWFIALCVISSGDWDVIKPWRWGK